jgi:Protein of unknown function (DUF3102)
MAIVQISRGTVAAARDRRATGMTGAVIELDTQAQFIAEIEVLWRQANENFLAIGRYLSQAKARLPHGEFETMVNSALPFGVSVARKLRAVAEAIDRKLLPPPDELPANYSTIYEMATLTEHERELAKKRALISREATRAQLLQFKREIRMGGTSPREARRMKLQRRRARLLKELARIDAALGVQTIDGEAHEVRY